MAYVTVSVPITTKQSARIESVVKCGDFSNRAEYIRSAIDAFEDRRLEQALAEAESEFRSGKSYALKKGETLAGLLKRIDMI